MSRHDNDAGRCARNLGNDTGLVIAVSIAGNLDGRVSRGDRYDGVVHPGRALRSVAPAVVPVVDVGHAVCPAGQVGLSGKRDQGVGLSLVRRRRGDGLGGKGLIL